MKQVVKFDRKQGASPLMVGCSAYLYPIDHPDFERVSNRCMARTSQVQQINDDGSFETLNSIYIPSERMQ